MTPDKTLLFIHGFACGGDVWNALSAQLESRGWRCEAPTLFHHLRTIGAPPDALAHLRLGDYVRAADDYARRIAHDDQHPPIVIGHGLGALIAQKLVERGAAGAGVFISPFAPVDCGPAFRSVALAFANILLTPASEREHSYVKPWRQGMSWGLMNDLPRPARAEALARLRHEPGNLVNELVDLENETTGAGVVDETQIDVPTLILAGRRDGLATSGGLDNMAEKLRRAAIPGDVVIHESLGHWLIAGPALPLIADEIDSWLARIADPDVSHMTTAI